MLHPIRTLKNRLREPVIADRWLDMISALSWLCLGLFGVFYTLGETSTVTKLTTETYSLLWGGMIGVLGLLAAAASFSTLWTAKTITRIRKKQLELALVCLLGGTVAVYPALKILVLFLPPFTLTEVASLAVALDFMIIPTWRVFHLVKRIRALRSVMVVTQPTPEVKDETSDGR